jgi:hypothetical protein
VSLFTEVPEELRFKGIEPPKDAHGFGIMLDEADPWGGGRVAGRVERLHQRRDERPVLVDVRCDAYWMDVAPQLVGRKGLLGWTTVAEIRNYHVPIWLDEEVFTERLDVGTLEDDNWRHFSFDLPEALPRALEGTFVAFRWRVVARRSRRIGHEEASVPLLLIEPQNLPVVRVETSPIGSWRLLEWRSEHDVGASAGGCSIAFEDRRPDDLPLPGETREAEHVRRMA